MDEAPVKDTPRDVGADFAYFVGEYERQVLDDDIEVPGYDYGPAKREGCFFLILLVW